MSIGGVTFCDLCGGVVGRYDIAPVRVDEDGRQVQLHLHNRHTNDCMAQMLIQLMDHDVSGALAPFANGSTDQPVQYDA